MNKNFDNLSYEATMQTFLLILEIGLNKGYTKGQYQDALDTEIKLVRNSLAWRYNYKYFNVSFSNVLWQMRSIYAFDFLQKYSPTEIISNFKLNNKCFFCDLWDPEKFFFPFSSFETKPIYLKNLQIGRADGHGNHKLLKAIADNNKEIFTDIKCIDDTEFLKEATTDGKYFYFKNEKFDVKDERNAILFNLVKLQMGFTDFSTMFKKFKYDKPRRVVDGI